MPPLPPAGQALLLVDIRTIPVQAALEAVHHYCGPAGPSPAPVVAVLNLWQASGVEEEAVLRGVRGFFYEQDSLETLLKGARALFAGEVWLSREVLVRMVLKSLGRVPSSEGTGELTRREGQVLALVACGATNEDIARELFISLHTVETHLSKAYGKIGVRGRMQAAVWMASHGDVLPFARGTHAENHTPEL